MGCSLLAMLRGSSCGREVATAARGQKEQLPIAGQGLVRLPKVVPCPKRAHNVNRVEEPESSSSGGLPRVWTRGPLWRSDRPPPPAPSWHPQTLCPGIVTPHRVSFRCSGECRNEASCCCSVLCCQATFSAEEDGWVGVPFAARLCNLPGQSRDAPPPATGGVTGAVQEPFAVGRPETVMTSVPSIPSVSCPPAKEQGQYSGHMGVAPF